MKVEPEDAFMLPANSMQELHVGIRPMSASRGSQLMYINVVDVELHQVHLLTLYPVPVLLLLRCSSVFSAVIYCLAHLVEFFVYSKVTSYKLQPWHSSNLWQWTVT